MLRDYTSGVFNLAAIVSVSIFKTHVYMLTQIHVDMYACSMKTIAVISQKGGVGKTTIALHLAVAASQFGSPAVVVDLDPQASATTWMDLRTADSPYVQPAQVSRLSLVLAEAEKCGAALAIIDTSPNSESASLAAARAADLVLIPCRPHLLDLKAISSSIEIARLAQKRFAVVLSAVPTHGDLGNEAVAALRNYDADVSPARISTRAAFYHCLLDGRAAQEFEPKGKAASEIRALFEWIASEIDNMYTCRDV
jgi:chromosome partitioning protein